MSFLFTDKGVTTLGFEILGRPLFEPVILLASFLNGEIDRESVPPLFSDPLSEPPLSCLVALGGVARYPEVLDPVSLSAASAASKIFRTFSSSVSVLAIRSRSVFHRCADSEWRRKVSPFFVTRSRTPRSMMERTFDVAGI